MHACLSPSLMNNNIGCELPNPNEPPLDTFESPKSSEPLLPPMHFNSAYTFVKDSCGHVHGLGMHNRTPHAGDNSNKDNLLLDLNVTLDKGEMEEHSDKELENLMASFQQLQENGMDQSQGSWLGVHGKIGILNVYVPQAGHLKEILWTSIYSLLALVNVTWLIFRDFIVARFQEERIGCCFKAGEANVLNNFISRRSLFYFPLCGRKFTRFVRDGSKASKLDRILVDRNFFDIWKDASVFVLHRSYLDHCLIFLKVGLFNFRPKPFKVLDKWLNMASFCDLVSKSWTAPFAHALVPPDITLKIKLKPTWLIIKNWVADQLKAKNRRKEEIYNNHLD
ncbi:RNA-directed DNA polymerase, eukaryota [Tanacetum coccineum]